jgi:hypothetical protein
MSTFGRLVVDGAARALRRAFDTKRPATRMAIGLLLGAATPLTMVLACSDDRVRTPIVGGGSFAGGPGIPDPCSIPNEGCACDSEGTEIDCGRVREQHDDYVTCSMGTRTCTDGAWTECVGDRVTIKSTSTGSPGLDPQALGAPQVCPKDAGVEFDLCDPYCNVTPDTPGGFDAGAGFNNSDAGLTIVATADAGVPCSTLAVVPTPAKVTAGNVVTVTSFGPPPVTTPTGPVTFNVTYGPMGCNTPSPFATTWTIDQVDRAQITGTNNTNGQLTIAVPLAGPIVVTIYALGTSATTTINVKVNVIEAPTGAGDPNEDATATQVTAFGTWNAPNAGTTGAGVTWLYPYADTYLPLALPPPVIQYWYTNTGGSGTSGSLQDRAVKVSLRYPVNTQPNPSIAAYSDFNYSVIVRESNVISQSAGVALDTRNPQVVIPRAAWEYFEQTARGQNADILVQRRRSTTLENESRRRIHFVDGQLKGTVYYNSYSSPLGGNVGAVLSIAPGATTPTLAVQPVVSGSRKCTVCHTVTTDGSKLIANTPGWSGSTSTNINQSRQWNLTGGGFPSPPVLNSYALVTPDPVGPATGEYEANQAGDRFTFGAPFLDGELYMTHGGRQTGSTGVGDPNFRAPPDYSNLRATDTPGSVIAVANWPTNMLAVTPRFSVDGTLLAFGYWGGNQLPCSATAIAPCTVTAPRRLSSDAAGTRLAVVDFSCSSPPCTSASTGWTVSNTRDVTPPVAAGINATTGTFKVGWPTITPSKNAVLYQRQYRTSKSDTEDATGTIGSPGWGGWPGWSPSHINTSAGALAEIWASNIPANGSTLASPTRLLALNGLNAAGVSYLPEDIRSVSAIPTPAGQIAGWNGFHRNAGASFQITQADVCSNTGIATGVTDNRLNYLPTFNPTEVGGFAWVVFTSRRMYGNIAYDDPWDAISDSCDSDTPPTKKLWVAAINTSFTPGTDPSYPAFYLPGQELTAGNSDGYWVNSPCANLNAPCVSNDDCCLATGASPTRECKVTSTAMVPPTRLCQNISACSATGGACATTADCCAGLTCPAGGGVCIAVPPPPVTVFTQQTTSREYVANCPHGTQTKWRFFEWQATVPAMTSITFSIQVKDSAAAAYQPAMPVLLSTATPASGTGPGTWFRGPSTVEQVLAGVMMPPVASGDYLRVTMTFNPSMTQAPTLHQWRQIFDCVPAE